MQLTNALCYALLTITMTATCIQAADRRRDVEERKIDRRLSRRDATVFIDGIPVEPGVHKSKVVYRRISKHRYAAPKPKYGSPRPKYGPPKSSRKPAKKYRGKISSKYRPLSHKKRASKPRYGFPKRLTMKPVYGPPKMKSPQSFSASSYHPEPMGFGEPPSSFDSYHSPKPDYDDFQKPEFDDFSDFQKPGLGGFHTTGSSDFQTTVSSGFIKPNSVDFHKPAFSDFHKPGLSSDGFQKQYFEDFPQKQGHAEPPVDSYGAPIRSNLHDLTYPTSQSFPEPTSLLDQDIYRSTFQSWKSLQQDQNIDNKYAFSKNMPTFSKPEKDVFVTPIPEEPNEELDLNSYSDIYNYRQMKDAKVKKQSNYNAMKMVNQPWKNNHKLKSEVNDDIIVGGQYAEPPARYVPKFQPSAPMFADDDNFAPPAGSMSDPDMAASATISPYVNYKNSNMAFSPQNLNDAFSIIDK